MSKKNKIDTSSHYRAILTDTLPYETPLFFSNEKLYLALKNGISDLPSQATSVIKGGAWSKPFKYEIHKGSGTTRTVSIPHPSSQIKIADFYRDFDGYIESICAKSKYSLRHPSRKGSRFYQTQFSSEEFDLEDGTPELDPSSFDGQRKWGSSYFTYKKYDQMYKFFAAREFLDLEKKYGFLLQLDVSRCFDSIYTHSISWAVRGKDFSKNHINSHLFESHFDKLMQNSNWGETNGILVGPESSRIFAEIILQSVDISIEKLIFEQRINAEIRRYLDDYMIFSVSETDAIKCKDIVSRCLLEINLHLNESKTRLIERPLASALTIARDESHKRIEHFFDACRKSLHPTPEHFPKNAASDCISDIRNIARKYGTSYSSLASPALAVIARNILRVRKRCGKLTAGSPPLKYASAVIQEMIAVSHFLFLMDMRMATSHKLAKIYYEASSLATRLGANGESLKRQLIDGMRIMLSQAESIKVPGPEIVNVLLAVDACCRGMKSISNADLASALKLPNDWSSGLSKLNYFGLITILYFSRKRTAFAKARIAAVSEIEHRILSASSDFQRKAEESLLYIDYLACPHIELDRRADFFLKHSKLIFAQNLNLQTAKTSVQKIEERLGFIHWNGSRNLHSLLAKKELQPAYE